MFLLRSCYSTSQQPVRMTDWMVSKPVLLSLEWMMMTLTVFLGRNAFIAHVFVITYLLLIVLYKINKLYGQFNNPHYLSFVIVTAGGIVHAFVPIVGHFFKIAMYCHLGICFCVHILHLAQCYLVFKDITFKDEEFITILWAVNIVEMIANVAFVLDDVFSEQHFIACSLAVQAMALLIVNLHLKIGGANGQQSEHSSSDDSTQSAVSHLSHFTSITQLPQEYIWKVMKYFDRQTESRVVLMIISAAAVSLMTLFPKYLYLIFMIALTIIMRLTVRKIARVCPLPSMAYILDQVLNVAPVVMLLFAFLEEFNVLSHDTGVAITLCAIVWAFGSIFLGLYTITHGECYSVPIGFLMMVTSTITSMLFMLEGETTKEVHLFATLTISTSVLFFTSRIHVNNNIHMTHGGKILPSRNGSVLSKKSGAAAMIGTSAKSQTHDSDKHPNHNNNNQDGGGDSSGKNDGLPRASELV